MIPQETRRSVLGTNHSNVSQEEASAQLSQASPSRVKDRIQHQTQHQSRSRTTMSDEELATKAPEGDATVEQTHFHNDSDAHEGPSIGVSNIGCYVGKHHAHDSQEHCVTDRPTRTL